MIHICYAIHDNDASYYRHTLSSIYSLLDNTDEKIYIHLIHDSSLSEYHINLINDFVTEDNQYIRFYNIEEYKVWNKIKLIGDWLSQKYCLNQGLAMLYRLFIYEILPLCINKVIYLDSDTIVNIDINKLWQETCETGIAAAIDVPIVAGVSGRYPSEWLQGHVSNDKYINSGVLLLDRKGFAYDKDVFWNNIKNFFSSDCEMSYPDQDFLNYTYSAQITILPYKYNILVRVDRLLFFGEEIKEGIFHFAGGAYNDNVDDFYSRKWKEYFSLIDRCR